MLYDDPSTATRNLRRWRSWPREGTILCKPYSRQRDDPNKYLAVTQLERKSRYALWKCISIWLPSRLFSSLHRPRPMTARLRNATPACLLRFVKLQVSGLNWLTPTGRWDILIRRNHWAKSLLEPPPCSTTMELLIRLRSFQVLKITMTCSHDYPSALLF